MRPLDLNSWSEFVAAIEDLKSKYGSHKVLEFDAKTIILFRGQAKAKWHLQTTLERYLSRGWTDRQYAELALDLADRIESSTGRDIESLTNRGYDFPAQEGLSELLAGARHALSYEVPLSHYPYWIYLRHYGFPSPLLDWTASPYIAAFFAMAKQNDAERASVFVYVPQPAGVKSGTTGTISISVQGSNARTDKRHFLQQSWYSVCTRHKDDGVEFLCHEDVFVENRADQDILYKITLARTERGDFLQHLQEMNINEFSLFQTEEALMQTLAIQEIELVDPVEAP